LEWRNTCGLGEVDGIDLLSLAFTYNGFVYNLLGANKMAECYVSEEKE
jgi:hypothetical protein